MFYTYVLQSKSIGITYIGQTNNLEDRLARHNSNRNKWTKNKGPWVLLYSCGFETRTAALALERKLKSFKNKEYLIKWIEDQKKGIG